LKGGEIIMKKGLVLTGIFVIVAISVIATTGIHPIAYLAPGPKPGG
jgi:hypothetical protein